MMDRQKTFTMAEFAGQHPLSGSCARPARTPRRQKPPVQPQGPQSSGWRPVLPHCGVHPLPRAAPRGHPHAGR